MIECLAQSASTDNTVPCVFFAGLGLIVVLLGWIALAYNGLVGLANHVRESWSDVDTELKRRYDLIPNLVETVKGYAAHEKDTL